MPADISWGSGSHKSASLEAWMELATFGQTSIPQVTCPEVTKSLPHPAHSSILHEINDILAVMHCRTASLADGK